MPMLWPRSVASCFAATAAIGLTGCAYRIPHQYAGVWHLCTPDANLMLLTTQVHGAHVDGELTLPKHFTEQPDGSFVDVTGPISSRPLAGHRHRKSIALQIGEPGNVDRASMVLLDSNHLSLDYFHGFVPAWQFQRACSGGKATLKTEWPSINTDLQVVSLRDRLRAEADKDKAAREKPQFDDQEMAQLEAQALPLLNEIFVSYGWPTVTIFGAEAAANFWLLVQHQELDTQRRMLPGLAEAVSAGEAQKIHYAYLFDRVQVLEGKPQHWGTQSRCELGHALLYPLDATTNEVNQRRKDVGLAALNGTESEDLCRRAAH